MKFVYKSNHDITIKKITDTDYYQVYLNKVGQELLIDNNLADCLNIVKENNLEYLNYHILIENAEYGSIKTVILMDYKNLDYKNNFSKMIHVYIPKNCQGPLGLIYMFDSDNAFLEADVRKYSMEPDRYGSWEFERVLELARLKYHKDFIVVGISSKDGVRDKELTFKLPYQEFKKDAMDNITEDFKNGQLDKLGSFIMETLRPNIENNFKIDERYIGIVGASSGGLSSHYLALKYMPYFKFAFVFSPANGIFTDETYEKFYEDLDFKNHQEELPYIYYYQGGADGVEKLLYYGNYNFKKLMLNSGFPKEKLKCCVNETFRHNEIAWRLASINAMEFVMEWLKTNE